MNTLFKLFMCAGMIRGTDGVFDRATKIAKYTFTHLFAIIYCIFLNLLWKILHLKVHEILYYMSLIIITIYVWYGFKGFIHRNLAESLKEIDRIGYTQVQVKRRGCVGVFLAFIAPFVLLITGIITLNNYNNW